MSEEHLPTEVDPFDLPEWLGVREVWWTGSGGLRGVHHVRGTLTDADGSALPCDLLAVDEAYPRVVADDLTRTRSHRAWHHGQVLLLGLPDPDGGAARLTLAVPGRRFEAGTLLDALGRLAKAVGASPDHYVAHLRIGAEHR